LCENTAPVLIPFDLSRPSRGHFFRIGGPLDSAAAASFASRALQRLFEMAASRTADGVECANDHTGPDRQDCPATLAEIADLTVDWVDGFRLFLCYDDPSRLCVEAVFSRLGEDNLVRTVSIMITTDATTGDPPPSTFQILGARIQHGAIAS
jgi:hypothetical protein